MKALVPLVGDIELYRLGKERPGGNVNLVTVKEPQEIIDGIYTTGKLTGTPLDEQSLVLRGKKDWYVLTGCSHSGVKEILDASREYGNVVGLIGGLHDFNNLHILG
ncbi:MAG: hypothetical protein KAR64_07410, partial [Thermoplasmatales archaeon]|nr:hypothetical protein [Thermoplasmatales archaeon]